MRDFDQDGLVDKLITAEFHRLELHRGIGRDKKTGASLFAKPKEAQTVYGNSRQLDMDNFLRGALYIKDVADFDGDGDIDLMVVRYDCASNCGADRTQSLMLAEYLFLENQSADRKKAATPKKK